MSGKSRQQASDLPPDGTGSLADCAGDQEPLLAMLGHALDELGLECQATAGARKSIYAQAFPVGEALGRVYGQRCLGSAGPQGLALLIERMLGLSAAVDTDPARRAVFSGFCWQLERILSGPCYSAPDDDQTVAP